MSSFTAHMLFNRPIDLPVGVRRTHIAEPWEDEPEKPPVSVYFRPHCAEKKAENIEAEVIERSNAELCINHDD